MVQTLLSAAKSMATEAIVDLQHGGTGWLRRALTKAEGKAAVDGKSKQSKQSKSKQSKQSKSKAGKKEAKTRCYTTEPRSDDKLGMAALSHLNVVVKGSVDEASAYYQEVLGFEPASNADGLMDYRNITLQSFCLDAGFVDGKCRVDIVFLKHKTIHMYLELFRYYEPESTYPFQLRATNDVGGVRHIAVEVLDAVHTYHTLHAMDHQGTFLTQQEPVQLTPFPYYFFYWIDKYGVQWEFEQGRPVKYFEIAGITG
eukprot:g68169.t1